MFGESESESPRTGSPWDGFLSKSDPASPELEPARSPGIVPKLVPEVEKGNVEYKLRLLNPSTERFTRLVTQLKWRLLEGGGQAYYELGVADSGQLVGLSRSHLEQSLQTLEEMAGEIGASVVVVKEIELPPALVAAVKDSSKSGKIADGAMRMHKMRVADYVETPPSSAGTDMGSELSIIEIKEDTYCCPSPTYLSPGIFLPHRSGIALSKGPDSISGAYDSPCGDDCVTAADLDFEIASVYKPRPHRRRTPTPQPTSPRLKHALSDDMFSLDLGSLHAPTTPADVQNRMRSSQKMGKDKEDLRRILLSEMPRLSVDDIDVVSGADSESVSDSPGADTVTSSVHLEALDDLEAAAAMLALSDNDDDYPNRSRRSLQDSPHAEATTSGSTSSENVEACNDIMHNGVLTPDDPSERRYIIEALVVRKLSVEEAFLDFVNI